MQLVKLPYLCAKILGRGAAAIVILALGRVTAEGEQRITASGTERQVAE